LSACLAVLLSVFNLGLQRLDLGLVGLDGLPVSLFSWVVPPVVVTVGKGGASHGHDQQQCGGPGHASSL